MKKKSLPLQLILFVLAVTILNAIIFYYINCSGDALQSKDIFGKKYTYTMEDILLQESILKNLPSDRNEAELFLRQQLQDLTIEYESNPDYDTEGEVYIALQDAKGPYEAVLLQLVYIKDYPDYVLGIAEHAEELLELDLYQQKGWLRNNIIQTRKDFYGLEGITLTPVTEAGYMSLINYRITDIFALLLTLGVVWMLAPSKELSVRKHYITPILIWLTGVCLMYLFNASMLAAYIGLPEFSVALQSLPPFQSCPYLISCGSLLVVCMLTKLAACVVVFCIGLFCVSCHKRLPIIVAVGLVVVELWLAFCGDQGGMWELLRELNLFSAFGVERFFLRYLNLDIGGQAISALTMFTVFLVLLVVIVVFVTIRRVSAYTREVQSFVERAYYDELDRRHEETRKIRHDMNNHLLALGLLIEKGDLTNAKTYIGEISEELDQTIMPVRTGSNVLDALIWQKLRQAHMHNIDIQTEIHCSVKDRNISDYDLCGIFGNILDNAMEAVTGMDKPTIHLFISNQLNMLYISCKNPYQGELKKRGEKFFTTKGDIEHHGYGIVRVKEIAKAYDGEVNISTEDEHFLIEILLNNK